jgi:hypothetical protein
MKAACRNRTSLALVGKKASLSKPTIQNLSPSNSKPVEIRNPNMHNAFALLTGLGLFWAGPVMGQGFTNLHSFVFTNGTYPRAASTRSLILSRASRGFFG